MQASGCETSMQTCYSPSCRLLAASPTERATPSSQSVSLTTVCKRCPPAAPHHQAGPTRAACAATSSLGHQRHACCRPVARRVYCNAGEWLEGSPRRQQQQQQRWRYSSIDAICVRQKCRQRMHLVDVGGHGVLLAVALVPARQPGVACSRSTSSCLQLYSAQARQLHPVSTADHQHPVASTTRSSSAERNNRRAHRGTAAR